MWCWATKWHSFNFHEWHQRLYDCNVTLTHRMPLGKKLNWLHKTKSHIRKSGTSLQTNSKCAHYGRTWTFYLKYTERGNFTFYWLVWTCGVIGDVTPSAPVFAAVALTISRTPLSGPYVQVPFVSSAHTVAQCRFSDLCKTSKCVNRMKNNSTRCLRQRWKAVYTHQPRQPQKHMNGRGGGRRFAYSNRNSPSRSDTPHLLPTAHVRKGERVRTAICLIN